MTEEEMVNDFIIAWNHNSSDFIKRAEADDAIEVPLDNTPRGRSVLFKT